MIGKFLVLPADSSNGVHRAIIPGNPCFTIHIGPFPVDPVQRAPGSAIVIERDIKGAAGPVAYFPLAEEMAARRRSGGWRSGIANRDSAGA